MSTYIQDEIPTIMANFTCITGNCSHLESTSVTTSSEAPFEDEPEAVPYTTIQAILIGMASGLLSLVTIVGKLQKIIRERVVDFIVEKALLSILLHLCKVLQLQYNVLFAKKSLFQQSVQNSTIFAFT